jgi:hypothetical protein
MNVIEIAILWAGALERVMVAAMMKLPLKWITMVQIAPIREMTIPVIIRTTTIAITKNPIQIPNPIPNRIIKKILAVVVEHNTDAVMTVSPQDLVLQE